MLDNVTADWGQEDICVTKPDLEEVTPASQLRARTNMLTSRQIVVMRMLSEGMINKQIAHELDISIATVKSHIAGAVRRMNAKNRIHAVAMLIRADCINHPPH